MTQQVAIVTGASAGIGRALTRTLVQRGLSVIAVARREKELQMLASELGTRCIPVVADVAEIADRERIVAHTPPHDVLYLVHNAALAEPLRLLSDVTLADFKKQMAVNVEAPLFLTQALLPQLTYGRVLHISTSVAHFAYRGANTYCMSKAALYMLYQGWKEDGVGQDIAFGSMMPGVVDTPMLAELCQDHFASREGMRELTARGQLSDPTLVARFITWLLLDIPAARFTEKEWDFYDATHHAEWAKDVTIVNPFS